MGKWVLYLAATNDNRHLPMLEEFLVGRGVELLCLRPNDIQRFKVTWHSGGDWSLESGHRVYRASDVVSIYLDEPIEQWAGTFSPYMDSDEYYFRHEVEALTRAILETSLPRVLNPPSMAGAWSSVLLRRDLSARGIAFAGVVQSWNRDPQEVEPHFSLDENGDSRNWVQDQRVEGDARLIVWKEQCSPDRLRLLRINHNTYGYLCGERVSQLELKNYPVHMKQLDLIQEVLTFKLIEVEFDLVSHRCTFLSTYPAFTDREPDVVTALAELMCSHSDGGGASHDSSLWLPRG